MSNQILIVTIGFIIAVMSSCGPNEDPKKYMDDSPSIKIQTAILKAESSEQAFTASGKIEAADIARISTRMMGYIEKIYADKGELVKKGQLLVSINSNDLIAQQGQINAAILEAEANVRNVEKDLNRIKRLFKNNSATSKELDDIQTNYDMAKARLESSMQKKTELEVQFSYTNIKSPISGIVSAKMANEGDLANPGMPIMEIESHNSLEVVALVPESEIGSIKMDMPVSIEIGAVDRIIESKVSEIAPSAKYTGGQYLVKAALDTREDQLKPGMYVRVVFPIEEKSDKQILLIPKSSIIMKGQLHGIYTISDDNRALLRWLRLGKSYGDKIEVLSGLSAGEIFVLSAEGKIVNGSKVNY